MCIVDLLNIPVSHLQSRSILKWHRLSCHRPESSRSHTVPSKQSSLRENEREIVQMHFCVTVFDTESQKREVTRGVVACVFIHLVPGAVLLLPDDHLPVVGAGGQDVSIHGVSPGHLPHRTLSDCPKRLK